MATRKKDLAQAASVDVNSENLVEGLISALNKEEGGKIAYRLDDPNNPSNIRDFISTGIKGLDYAISNRRDGGIPVGRITNFFGKEGAGKSLLAIKTAVSCQKMGGIVVYFDSESALDQDFPSHLGLDKKKTMVVTDLTVEKVFNRMEFLINKFRENPATKDKKLLFIWDSLAGTATEREQEIDMTDIKKLMGERARVIGAGFRKIGQKIAKENIALIVLNQLNIDLTVTYGDNETQSGGRGMLHWCTVIVKLNKKNMQTTGSGDQMEGKSADVRAKIIKNRCGPPFRSYEFTMDYLSGPHEHQQIVQELNRIKDPVDVVYNGKNLKFVLHEAAGKYTAMVFDPAVNPEGKKEMPSVLEAKFSKNIGMADFVNSEEWHDVMEQLLELIWRRKYEYAELHEEDDTEDDDSYLINKIEMDEMRTLARGLSGEKLSEYEDEE